MSTCTCAALCFWGLMLEDCGPHVKTQNVDRMSKHRMWTACQNTECRPHVQTQNVDRTSKHRMWTACQNTECGPHVKAQNVDRMSKHRMWTARQNTECGPHVKTQNVDSTSKHRMWTACQSTGLQLVRLISPAASHISQNWNFVQHIFQKQISCPQARAVAPML